jgi:hypothetical protein
MSGNATSPAPEPKANSSSRQDFLRAAESQGFPVTDDLQDLTTAHGAEVKPHGRLRSSMIANKLSLALAQMDQQRYW